MDDDLATSGTMTATDIAVHVTVESTPAIVHVESDDEEAEEDELGRRRVHGCLPDCHRVSACNRDDKTFLMCRSSSTSHISAIDLLDDLLCAQRLSRGNPKSLIFFQNIKTSEREQEKLQRAQ